MSSNPVSAAPAAKTNRPVFKAMTRKEVATKYEIGTKTLNRWLDKAGLKLPSGLLPPSQVERLWDMFGEW